MIWFKLIKIFYFLTEPNNILNLVLLCPQIQKLTGDLLISFIRILFLTYINYNFIKEVGESLLGW